MAQDYNKTLNLPQTDFAMRASLPQREPGMLAEWNEENLYQKMVDRNEGKPTYILHDGPPYANGDIHLGTALNKVLKDMIDPCYGGRRQYPCLCGAQPQAGGL